MFKKVLLSFAPMETPDMQSIYILITIAGLAGLSVVIRKVTVMAGIVGAVIGAILYIAAGLNALTLLAVFFVLGTTATYLKRESKLALNLHENTNGRTAFQVLANGGMAGLLALAILIFPLNHDLCKIMIAACFASATSDTLSSELGNIYGKKFYNVLSLKKDTKGLDGVVSLEGTLFGLAGAAVIALIYIAGNNWSANFYTIVSAGMFGNVFDSILGATLERRKLINNDLVNFANTAFAATVAMVLWLLF